MLGTCLRWSSKNRQCEVLPSTAHARNSNPSGPPLTRKKYTPAFKAECVRQVAAGARQTDVARAQGLSPALLGRWQRQALAEAVPSSAEREEIKRLHAELKRVEQERDILKKVVTIFAQPPQS
ncbi:MAG TPA: transposase [Hymenobacter sp.]|jgi:transposase